MIAGDLVALASGLQKLREHTKYEPTYLTEQEAWIIPDQFQALTERLAQVRGALQKMVDASEGVHVYPEGSFGFEELQMAEDEAKEVLERRDPEPEPTSPALPVKISTLDAAGRILQTWLISPQSTLVIGPGPSSSFDQISGFRVEALYA